MRRVSFSQVSRPRMGKATKAILAINLAIYLVELIVAYLVDFDPMRMRRLMLPLFLSPDRLLDGWVWQLFSYMWLHDPDSVGHIGFNLIVLYFFAPSLEQRWGTRRFVRNYLIFGLGGAAAVVLTALGMELFFDRSHPPVLGASAAIAGLVAAFCIYHWTATLRTFFIEMKGRTLLIIFIVIDVIRVVAGEPIAVQAHWGGMLTAAFLIHPDWLSPSLIRLKLKRWRLRRRLRLKQGGSGGNGDPRVLH